MATLPTSHQKLRTCASAGRFVVLALSVLCVNEFLAIHSVGAQEKAAAEKKQTRKKSPNGWKPLFDGKTLKGWEITKFGGEGEVVVEDGVIVFDMGSSLTGIHLDDAAKKGFPKCDYELIVEAKRIDGIDFFSTITFPVEDSFCSLVVGGWAGAVVGISCIDHFDASENETTSYQRFEDNKWYRIRIEVRKDRIRAWIDEKKVVDVDIRGRRLTTRSEVELSQPFGITSWETRAGIRKIQVRRLPKAGKDKKRSD